MHFVWICASIILLLILLIDRSLGCIVFIPEALDVHALTYDAHRGPLHLLKYFSNFSEEVFCHYIPGKYHLDRCLLVFDGLVGNSCWQSHRNSWHRKLNILPFFKTFGRYFRKPVHKKILWNYFKVVTLWFD